MVAHDVCISKLADNSTATVSFEIFLMSGVLGFLMCVKYEIKEKTRCRGVGT